MEVRVEKKKRREADDPVIYAQASEWIHQGVSSVMDPTSTRHPTPPHAHAFLQTSGCM